MKVKNVLVLCGLMALVPSAFAGGVWTNVTVTHVMPCQTAAAFTCGNNATGMVVVTFSANSTTNASCAASFKNQAVIDITNAAGGFMAAVLQSAFLSGSTITAYGVNSCTIVSNVETLGEVVE
jgi:hypothetical protein